MRVQVGKYRAQLRDMNATLQTTAKSLESKKAEVRRGRALIENLSERLKVV